MNRYLTLLRHYGWREVRFVAPSVIVGYARPNDGGVLRVAVWYAPPYAKPAETSQALQRAWDGRSTLPYDETSEADETWWDALASHALASLLRDVGLGLGYSALRKMDTAELATLAELALAEDGGG